MRVQILMGVVLCLATGCGGGTDLAPVSGVITMNGKPLEGATVTFSPADIESTEDPASFGITDENGRFELETFDGRTGAVIGKHSVAIVKENGAEEAGEDEDEDDSIIEFESEVPSMYNDKTTLDFDVTKEGSDQANFKLVAKKGWREKDTQQRLRDNGDESCQ